MAKLLAEWFWTDRWIGSSAFLLPMEARGLYREMLTQAWRRGGHLPTNHEAIRRAIGCTPKEWERSWPKIAKYWRVDGDVLVNDTQAEVYAEAERLAETRVKKASLAAEAKWIKHRAMQAEAQQNPTNLDAPSTAQAAAKHMLQTCPPSPSPSLVERSKDLSSARGKVFVGSCLIVSQKQHAFIVGEIGPAAADFDWMALYPAWDACLVDSRQSFETLTYLRLKAGEHAKRLRYRDDLLGSHGNGDDPELDWFEECQQMHGGRCGGHMNHHTRKILDAAKPV